MGQSYGAETRETEEPAVSTTVPVAAPPSLSSAETEVLGLQRMIGNRATARLLRQPKLQRAPKAKFSWPAANQNSPYPTDLLMSWLASEDVAPLNPDKYENFWAYDANRAETDPDGCAWGSSASKVTSVADAFIARSSNQGYCYSSTSVTRIVRDYVSKAKRERTRETLITFLPKADWKTQTERVSDGPFPWGAYADDTDQFDSPSPRGPAGPIRDWLWWYGFDAQWPVTADPDACILNAQGETTARVGGVARLYNNDATRAGFLGVDPSTVRAYVAQDLKARIERKKAGHTEYFDEWSGVGMSDGARHDVFGTSAKADAPDDDPGDAQVQFQYNYTKHTPMSGGKTSTDPPTIQVTAADVVAHIGVPGLSKEKAGEFQISLQGSASFTISQTTDPPTLTGLIATLSSVQGAAQGAWAKDLFTDLLQLQVFAQVAASANYSAAAGSNTGVTTIKTTRAEQVAGGVQLAFTVPGTGKHLQIFVQGQVSKTWSPGGDTNDKQGVVGISYAFDITDLFTKHH